MSKKTSDRNFTNKNDKKTTQEKYIGYHTKAFIYLVTFVASLFLASFVLNFSFSIIEEKKINYQENSNIDYKVYLKDNDFYENEFLDKNKVYVASLIRKIDVNYDYTFKIDTKSDINFNYDIVGTLVIADNNGDKIFFEKDYTLLENTSSSIVHGTFNNINKTVSIDYEYFNNLANKFKTNYGVDTTSNLIVKLKIREDSNDKTLNLTNKSEMSITIPLSEREISISMDYEEVNKNNQIVSNSGIIINNYAYIALGIVFLIIALIFMIKLFKLLVKHTNKKSKYDTILKRILKEYDRLIVNTTTPPDNNGNKVIEVKSFEELLDVRDNLKLPIKYYSAIEHQESKFYINHDKELYLYTLKPTNDNEK